MSFYSKITPACDYGKRRPKKRTIRKLVEICKRHNLPVRNRLNPGFATVYQREFLAAFRRICEIFQESDFVYPEKQVLILMLENGIHPCRAEKFSEEIIRRLADDIFT